MSGSVGEQVGKPVSVGRKRRLVEELDAVGEQGAGKRGQLIVGKQDGQAAGKKEGLFAGT